MNTGTHPNTLVHVQHIPTQTHRGVTEIKKDRSFDRESHKSEFMISSRAYTGITPCSSGQLSAGPPVLMPSRAQTVGTALMPSLLSADGHTQGL